ncbi:MAG: hypothetical protein AABY22_32170, partial [Nanoarchaeota archaeon]
HQSDPVLRANRNFNEVSFDLQLKSQYLIIVRPEKNTLSVLSYKVFETIIKIPVPEFNYFDIKLLSRRINIYLAML